MKQEEFIKEFNEFYGSKITDINYPSYFSWTPKHLFNFITHLLEKEKQGEVNWEWVEEQHFKWYKSKYPNTTFYYPELNQWLTRDELYTQYLKEKRR